MLVVDLFNFTWSFLAVPHPAKVPVIIVRIVAVTINFLIFFNIFIPPNLYSIFIFIITLLLKYTFTMFFVY